MEGGAEGEAKRNRNRFPAEHRAWHGTRSHDPEITTGTEIKNPSVVQPTEPPTHPKDIPSWVKEWRDPFSHAYWLKETECRNQGHDSKTKETGSFKSCIRSPPAPGPPKGHSFCWTKLLQSEQSDRIGPILGGQLLSGTPTRREVSPLGPIIQVSGPRNSISSTSTGGWEPGLNLLRVWVRQRVQAGT